MTNHHKELFEAALRLSDALHQAEAEAGLDLPDYVDRAWRNLSLSIEDNKTN